MARLNQERQAKLEPIRHNSTRAELNRLGFEIFDFDDKKIRIVSPNGHMISFFPYSGWFSGKGIIDGRGFNNLIKQLEAQKQ